MSKKIKYICFRDIWLEETSPFKPWIAKCSNSNLKARCVICCKDIDTVIGVYALESRQVGKKQRKS